MSGVVLPSKPKALKIQIEQHSKVKEEKKRWNQLSSINSRINVDKSNKIKSNKRTTCACVRLSHGGLPDPSLVCL